MYVLTTGIRPVPWETLREETFLFEDRCWLTCNGGFCCSNNHPDFQLQFIPTQGTTILYMEDEYQWLAEHGKVGDPQATGSVANVLSIDFGGPRPLSLIHVPCRLLGMCQGVIDKPLLCKLSPMLPVLGVDGSLESITESGIFELTMRLRGVKSPCTVLDKRKLYWNKWKNAPEHLESLRHPYIILYLQAAKHFTEIYSKKLQACEALEGLTGKQFWSSWEIEYLLGNLIDQDQLADKIRQTYGELVAYHGSFLQAA
jgi:hypothetical protein